MILNDLEMFYGFFNDDVKKWISEKLKWLTESEQTNFLNYIKKDFPKKNGLPTIEVLQKTLSKVTGKAPTIYYWNQCMDCGAEYDYKLTMCPSCFENGIECRAYNVKTSTTSIPANVIRYNKTYIGDGKEKICYTCEERKMSYCKNFGNPEWTCKDYSECRCSSCCASLKKENQKIIDKNAKEKITYGKPIGAKNVL